jgi:hypothetical protein
MIAKMSTGKAQEIYKLRQQIVEPVFGDIKENKGMIGFLTRGIQSARTEFSLMCMARNIKRIWDALKGRTRAITYPANGKGRPERKSVLGGIFSLRFSTIG